MKQTQQTQHLLCTTQLRTVYMIVNILIVGFSPYWREMQNGKAMSIYRIRRKQKHVSCEERAKRDSIQQALPPKQSRLTNPGWVCNYQLCLTSAINTPDQSDHLTFLCGNVSYCPARGGTSPHTAAASVNSSRDRNATTSSSSTVRSSFLRVSPNPPCLCRWQGSRKEWI